MQLIFFILLTLSLSCSQRCNRAMKYTERLQFSLVRQCQRSQQQLVALENTKTLEECMTVAKQARGLALNYAPSARRNKQNKFEETDSDPVIHFNHTRNKNRQHFWQQPQEFFNCHILKCPENSTFRTMTNDSRFDYFSLYGRPTEVLSDYTCLPEVGLFKLKTTPESYLNASKICSDVTMTSNNTKNTTNTTNFTLSTGSLAHVASSDRTNKFALLLETYNEHSDRYQNITGIHLAYVGLHFNRSYMNPNDFHNAANESLNCFLYRAWSPGYPKRNGPFINTSCVAITTQREWITVNCARKLPFICEIHTSTTEDSDFDISAMFADECWDS